jgi:cytochrome c-type biogenesis protein CcmH/NrfG
MTVARHVIAGLIGLGIIGVSFGAATLHAQCAPPVQRLITDRQYDEARAELQTQLRRVPNDDAAMECMGRLRLEQGESGDAVAWLEKAVAINGQSGQHHQWLGTALRAEAPKANMLRQPFLGARMKTEFEQAVALDPTLIAARAGAVLFVRAGRDGREHAQSARASWRDREIELGQRPPRLRDAR